MKGATAHFMTPFSQWGDPAAGGFRVLWNPGPAACEAPPPPGSMVEVRGLEVAKHMAWDLKIFQLLLLLLLLRNAQCQVTQRLAATSTVRFHGIS